MDFHSGLLIYMIIVFRNPYIRIILIGYTGKSTYIEDYCTINQKSIIVSIEIVKKNSFNLNCQLKHTGSRMEMHVNPLCIIKIIPSHGY